VKKLLLLSILFAGIGCSHGAKNYADITAYEEPTSYKYLGPNDRAPAGEPTLAWEPHRYNFTASARGGSLKYDAKIEQIMTWKQIEPEKRTRQVLRDQWVWENCYDYQCTGDGGGQSPAWDAFYSAKKDQKAQKLADAISGLNKDAKELVDRGYFHSKPRSWNAFRDEIRRAEKAGIISKQVASEILVNHRQENFVNLGYAPDSCGTVTYRCEVYKSVLVDEDYIENVEKTYTKVNDVVHRQIEVNVANPRLQSFEKEQIRVTVGKEQNEVRIDSDLTVYDKAMSHEGATTRIQLSGRDRVKVDLPSEAYRAGAKLLKAGPTKAQFSFNVDPKYVPGAQDPNDQLVVRYQVLSCERTWLKPVCGLLKMDKEGPIQYAKISSSNPTIDIDVPKNHTLLVKFSIGRRNSVWYNDHFLPEQKTDKLKL
jgi:hypothetical protein